MRYGVLSFAFLFFERREPAKSPGGKGNHVVLYIIPGKDTHSLRIDGLFRVWKRGLLLPLACFFLNS